MVVQRPDLSSVDDLIVKYVEALELEIERLQGLQSDTKPSLEPQEPSEPPTTLNIITITTEGMAKRTPRHLYFRQRRNGMGVFDIEMGSGDRPRLLVQADEADTLILVTNLARAFRLPVRQIVEGPVHSRGRSIVANMTLRDDEQIRVAFRDNGGAHVALVSERGQVRRVASRYFGPSFQSGTVLYDVGNGDAPAAACWTTGVDDLFIATRSGRAIRFSERQVPVRGCLGLRVVPSDEVVGVAALSENDGVFLINAEGKGTIRLMAGFSANKSPGAGGKVAMRTEQLVGVLGVRLTPDASEGVDMDIFVISELGKLIRFSASEVPPKEGVVQGVNCMNLRNDTCVALTSSG